DGSVGRRSRGRFGEGRAGSGRLGEGPVGSGRGGAMSPDRRLVAGVDSSTQSCKVVIADAASGAVVRTGSAPHPPGTEVDPEQWWTALQTAITAAGGLDDVAAVSISGQQHGLIALDSQGRVIRDALL